MIKSITIRFLKGAIAGAITSMSMIALNQPTVWNDIKTMLSALAIAGTYGAITGLLLALQKLASWKD